jgi:lipopolysaccharide export system protein LptA
LILGLVAFFLGHFVLLSPSNLEDDFTGIRVINPKDLLSLLRNEADAPDVLRIPKNTPPAYSLRDAVLYSSQGTTAGFRLDARKTNSYQKEQISELRDVHIELGDQTRIDALAAIHDTLKNEIEFRGAVHARFRSGAEINTERLFLLTKPRTKIMIPKTESVTGYQTKGLSRIEFMSKGLEYEDLNPGILELLSEVRVRTRGAGGAEISSDRATYSTLDAKLTFLMNDRRPIPEQFVRVREPALDLKSRTLEMDFSNEHELETIRAKQDVWFKDSHDPNQISIGTGGAAIYSTGKNQILLTDFPQLYQDNDTITGDSIIFHRDSDSVEVKQSNAIYNRSKK